jgi:hypothetical protein
VPEERAALSTVTAEHWDDLVRSIKSLSR